MAKGEETRDAILHQGVETAYRVGLGGLTIGELARSTELSKSGLFAHFRSKESLQLQVLARAREEFVATVLRPAVRVPRGEQRVRALFDNWLYSGVHRTAGVCLYVKALSEFEEQTGAVRDQVLQGHRDLYDSVSQIFRTGISEGQFRSDADPMQFAFELNGLLLAAYNWVRVVGPEDAERRARHYFETLLETARA
ncbi:TetR family transcriptional regulator [Microlunatus endophyticus]|uniref:TetR family transcriptional regulator n=1 Tax=Microlunatus endophyticus TaxID=1716077 RepID=A0A917S0T2_9ACTN|nr:TetR/AcrR family transcriptional regulator [Microlunatus endophyticus]GGL50513.1 TetR family transcriptional regulator [Microlunatus endophyticus]